MIRELVLIQYIPLTASWEKNLYIRELQAAGIAVSYWDVSRIFFPRVAFPRDFHRDYVTPIDTYAWLEEMLAQKDMARTVFVPQITLEMRTLRLFRMLTRCHCTQWFYGRGTLPVSSQPLARRLARALFSIRKILWAGEQIILRLLRKSGYVKRFDLVFYAGSAARSMHMGARKLVPINYFDYDEYLLQKGSLTASPAERTCVYLDDNLLHDTDNDIVAYRSLNAQRYLRDLTAFFDHLERAFDVRVVIAASPKARYAAGAFGGRRIVYNETQAVVRDCIFVVEHYSSAISYAVLYRKPAVFMYTREMEPLPYFTIIRALAHALKSPLCRIDDSEAVRMLTIPTVNDSAYDTYTYAYLSNPESKDILSRDMVVRTAVAYVVQD